MPSGTALHASSRRNSIALGWGRKTVLALAVIAGCESAAEAQQLYWNPNGTAAGWTDSNWGTSTGGPFESPWVAGSTAEFTANSTINYVTGTVVGNVTVAPAVTVTVAPAGTYTTGGTVSTMDVGTGSTLDFGTQAVSTAAGTGFIKNGAGMWVTGPGGTFAGGFTLNAGTVAVGGVNALGDGGTLTLNGGTLRSTSTTARDLSGKYDNGIFIGGNVIFGDAVNTGGLTFTNPVSLGSATRTITTSSAVIINSVISGDAGVGLIKTGGSSLDLALNAANTYTGDTFIKAGTVFVRNASAFGTTGSITLGDTSGNATVFLRQSSVTLNRPIILATGTTGVITINNLGASANPVFSGGITGTNNLVIQSIISSSSGSITFNTASINHSGALRIDNSGAGTLATTNGTVTINSVIGSNVTTVTTQDVTTGTRGVQKVVFGGANAYTGNTIVTSGILQFGTSNVIPDGAGKGNVAVTGTLDVNGKTETVNGLSGAGTIDNSTGAGVLTVGGNDATSTFSGVIKQTAGSLAIGKTGSGVFTLGSTLNSYTGGTRLSGGTLRLGAAGVLPDTGAVSFDGGTLDSNGFADTVGPLTLLSGTSTVQFGALGDSGNVLTFAGSSLTGGTLSVTAWDGNATAGGGDDQFRIIGLPADSLLAAIQFINPAGFAAGTYPAGTIDVGGGAFEVVPVPVPEPAGAAALLVAATGLLARRGRRSGTRG